ncbi:MAG: terpene cyclase/mutase family protein [Planctomycetes bacterium]|nr:terpene cyclase/mutase family protein [Planctomycetota bacterium]
MKDETAPTPAPLDHIVEKTPWWTLSVGLHTLATLLMAYFLVLGRPVEATDVPLIRQPRSHPPEQPEFIKDIPEKAPVPLTQVPEREQILDPDPEATPESRDFEDHRIKGENTDFVTRQPFNSRATNSAIGAGANAAGSKGGPWGGRFDRGRSPNGRPSAPPAAVLSALRWLARHQDPDGPWRVQAHVHRCRPAAGACPTPQTAHEDFDTGVTGLALLAFLGAGYTHLSRDVHDGLCFGDVVRRALQWLQSHQDPVGCIGPRTAHKYMYNHAIAALALVEAYGMTGSRLIEDSAQRSVDFLVAAQNPGWGWRYSLRCGDNDTSVTGWAVMALKSAELSGLAFPRSAYDGCRAWLDEVTEENYYRAGYTHRETGKVHCAHNEAFDHHEALTAISMMTRLFMDRDRSQARVRGAADLLVADLPAWSGNAIDFYYWYYAALALFQFDADRQGLHWRRFEERLQEALVPNQSPPTAGCRAGSWEPVDRWSCEGGRVYATAINALTLEVHFRYPSVFTGTRK